MSSPVRNRTLPSGLALLGFMLIAAQAQFTYSDKTGDVGVVAREGSIRTNPDRSMRLTLRGSPVTATSKDQGVTLEGTSIVALLVQSSGKKTRLSDATATGSVTVTKVATTPTGTRRTIIKSSSANYKAGTTESVVVLTGSVSIRNEDSAKRQTVLATGSSGVARLEPATTTRRESALRSATLAGPVRVVLNEQGAKGPSTSVATGDRMVLDNRPGAPTVTLTGNVRIQGQMGRFDHLGRAVLRLNAKWELVGFDTSVG